MKKIKVPVEVSASHIHLSRKDVDKLFGKNFLLTKARDLSQEGQFAAKQRVSVKVKGHELNLRVVGPERNESQIEMSMTDAVDIGVKAPLVLSGDLKKVKTLVTVKGPEGKAKVKAIIAKRHLHISHEKAKKLSLKKGSKVNLKIIGDRAVTFKNVIIRPRKDYTLAAHLDTDEANACGLGKVCGQGYIFK